MKTISATKSAQFVNVTPALAAKWLENNTNNRKQRGTYIADIANAMRRGEWQPTHQGIAFSKCGKLLDGQHRLEAVLRAKVELEMLVVTGLDDKTFSVIDVGAKRTLADTTKLSKRTAETCRFFVKNFIGGGQPTAAQAIEVANCGVERLHEKLLSYCGSIRAVYAGTGMRAAAVTLILAGHNEEVVLKNYADLVLERYSEMNSLSQSFVRLVNANKVSGSNARTVYVYGLKALNPDNGQMLRLRMQEDDFPSAMAYGKSVITRNLQE